MLVAAYYTSPHAAGGALSRARVPKLTRGYLLATCDVYSCHTRVASLAVVLVRPHRFVRGYMY